MIKWFRRNKQEKYRVKIKPPKMIEVFLILPDEELLMGDLTAINLDGATAYFPHDRCPEITIDQEIKLKLDFLETRQSVTLDTVVKGCIQSEEKNLCRFLFTNPEKISQEIDPSLWEYFNRRSAVRFQPAPHEPIEVKMTWEGGIGTGRVIDISTTGMALEIDPEIADLMGKPERITLSFELPNADMTLKLVGTIAYQKSWGTKSRYGIMFDWNWNETEDFEKQEAAIAVYLISLRNK